MSIATLWDRFFWSFMLMVFAGLVWVWFFGESVRYFPFGLLTGLAVGGAYFAKGVRGLVSRDRVQREAIGRADTAAEAARAAGGTNRA